MKKSFLDEVPNSLTSEPSPKAMPPRVLFLNHTAVMGGAEFSLLDLMAYYPASQSRILLFEDGPFRKRLEAVGAHVELLPMSKAVSGIRREGNLLKDLKSLPGVLQQVWKVVRSARNFDLLYANSQKGFVVAALAGWLTRKPVIWYLHDLLDPSHFSDTHSRLVVRLANLWASRILTNSKASAHAFVQQGGRADHIHVVHVGIDAKPFLDIAPQLVQTERARLGLNGVPVVSVFSRLAAWKGQHILLEALANLSGVHALLVGSPLFGEEAYAEALKEKAQTLGIADRVHFAGFQENIAPLMHLSDIVLHTSIAPEPFGRVVVEGMLAGRPVIATRAGGVPEIIDEGKTGLLVPPGDSEAITQAIRHLLDHPQEAAAMAQAGREAARSLFSVERMQHEIEKHIQEVAQAASR